MFTPALASRQQVQIWSKWFNDHVKLLNVNARDLLVIYKVTFIIISVKCCCVWGDLDAHVL